MTATTGVRVIAPTIGSGLRSGQSPDDQSDFLQKHQSTRSCSPEVARAFAWSTVAGGGTITLSPGCQFSVVATL